MKRSTRVSLVLLASVSAAASLSGCDQTPDTLPDNGGTFTTKAECIAVYDQATCDRADRLAQQEHLQNAPKFNSLDSCAAQYGPDACRPASAYGGSGNMYLPVMTAFMLGSAMSTPAPLYYGPGAYRHRYDNGYSAPLVTSGRGFPNHPVAGSAPYMVNRPGSVISTKGALKSTTALTPPGSTRGGFGTSFKPTKTFTATYAHENPTSFGRSSLSPSTGSFARAASAGRVSSTSSGFHSSGSVSSRGGFGSMGRGFSGGFGG